MSLICIIQGWEFIIEYAEWAWIVKYCLAILREKVEMFVAVKYKFNQ